MIQLNMGEGKTWVIVPLLALSLANGNDLCRITVLKSLFQISELRLSKATVSTREIDKLFFYRQNVSKFQDRISVIRPKDLLFSKSTRF